MTPKLKVLIADDHPMFRDGLRQAISKQDDIHLVGEASDGHSALASIRKLKPDVAVLDVSMPLLSGFKVAETLNAEGCQTRIVFLTMHDQEDMFNRAMSHGALGYILKESAVIDLLQCIRTVAAGKHYISAAISGFLMQRNNRREVLREKIPNLGNLTPSERRILKLISEDKTSKEIAANLGISFRTVETHRANLSAKLGLHGSHSLLRFAFDHRDEL